jgi:alpha-tubulin suppressor-like RCC1 family protein
VQLVAGSYDTCALKDDRSVWCWGGGNATPARIATLTNVVELASGTFHKCARKTDGTVWCWGANGAGQIGDGTTELRDAPVQVKLADGRATFIQISAGGFSSCARLQGGSVWCWGANGAGQAGNGVLSSNAPTPVQVTAVDSGLVAEIVAEGGHGCARLQSGALRCWGGNTDGELGVGSSDTSPRLTSIEVAALGTTVVRTSGRCAIKDDLTLWCWGLNTSGQVGDGSTALRTGPVQITTLGNNVVEVTRTFLRTCARKSDGSVWCWGRNGDGGLGDGTINGQPCPSGDCKPTPVRVSGISDAAAIASGIGHACAARNDGTTWCWGTNGQGQLGEGMVAGQSCSGGPCRPQAVRSLLTCP